MCQLQSNPFDDPTKYRKNSRGAYVPVGYVGAVRRESETALRGGRTAPLMSSRKTGEVMPTKERFICTRPQVDAWFIKDTKDDSIVCIMQKGKRPPEHPEAMIQVMLDALNRAASPRQETASR